MIYTLTLNLNLDLIYQAGQLDHNLINRARMVSLSVGGKGINICRALGCLGLKSQALGFYGGALKSFIAGQLLTEKIDSDLLPIEQPNRINTKIIETRTRRGVEINALGPHISPTETGALINLVKKKVRSGDFMVLAGSLPLNMKVDIYGKIIQICRQKKVKVLLDVSGKPLEPAIAAVPNYLSINRQELNNLNPQQKDTPLHIRQLLDSGIEAILITDGSRKAIYGRLGSLWQAIPPRVEGLSTVGSGDSVDAGFLYGIIKGLPPSQVLATAVACGTANLLTDVPGQIDPKELDCLKKKVEAKPLEIK